MLPATISISRESLGRMDDQLLSEIVSHMAYTMLCNAGSGAFEGTLEMMDSSAIPTLRASFWQNAVVAREQSHELTDLGGMIGINKVQPWAAMVFEEAARRGDAAYSRIGRISNEDCAEMAMMIEEWQTRYEPEDEPEDGPMLH